MGPEPSPPRRSIVAIGILVTIIVIGLAWLAASGGVRGTDQYWYLADVETLLNRGSVISESIFPVGILGPGGTLTPPFIHSVLGTFLAVIPASLVGPYWGWIVLNVGATLLTASLIYLTARTVADRWAALLCAIAYPLLPVTMWHTTQPLTEASTALLAALAVYLLAIARLDVGRWLAVIVAAGLLYFSRESYLVLLLAVPVGYALSRIQAGVGLGGSASSLAILSLATIGMVVVGQILLPHDNVAFSYARLANTAIPGVTDNMWFNFDLSEANLADHAAIPWAALPGKFASHLVDQFARFNSAPIAIFYWTFDLLAIVAVAMAWRSRHRPAEMRLVVAALAFVGVHVFTIALFQNQVRYTVPALPALMTVLAIALSSAPRIARWIEPHVTAAAVVLIIVAILPNTVLAIAERNEGLDFGAAERASSTLVDSHLRPNDPLIMVYAERPQVLAFGARGRPILYVDPAYSVDDFARLRSAFPAAWLLAPAGSPAVTGLGADTSSATGSIDALGDEWVLYRLPDQPSP